MAPEINPDLFWDKYIDYSDLSKLKGIFDQIDFDPLIEAIRRKQNFSERQDWPVIAMLNSLVAMIVFRHRSTESFQRELQRNPSLMLAVGFELKTESGKDCSSDPFAHYKVPSAADFSRFHALVMEIEEEEGLLHRQFEPIRELQSSIFSGGRKFSRDEMNER